MKPENQEKAQKLFEEKNMLKENLIQLQNVVANQLSFFYELRYPVGCIVEHKDVAEMVKILLINKVESRLEQIDKELETL
jgi:hypothetical protein